MYMYMYMYKIEDISVYASALPLPLPQHRIVFLDPLIRLSRLAILSFPFPLPPPLVAILVYCHIYSVAVLSRFERRSNKTTLLYTCPWLGTALLFAPG
ncbi:uncharacterized protein UV8b_00074 [Ustilaginoidea virens]|uniref:Uncharacterized protein n=1 Tax=Ustilaginoidea virens TaxID=1159556 RepID=A0A8E5HIA2_USTVR|nr:uncharacterized protein UV8b_00074 [Ustilaginoidea virens]QUC15833.1 hypothetical protein UV8b_00074 [Ustilaginoidea virens]